MKKAETHPMSMLRIMQTVKAWVKALVALWVTFRTTSDWDTSTEGI